MSNIKEMTELKQLIISWLINHDVAENKLTSILTILSGHDASGADTNQTLIERLQVIDPAFHGVALKDDYVYKVKEDKMQIPIQPSDHIDSPMKMDATIRNTKSAKDIVEGLRGIRSKTHDVDYTLDLDCKEGKIDGDSESPPEPVHRLADGRVGRVIWESLGRSKKQIQNIR